MSMESEWRSWFRDTRIKVKTAGERELFDGFSSSGEDLYLSLRDNRNDLIIMSGPNKFFSCDEDADSLVVLLRSFKNVSEVKSCREEDFGDDVFILSVRYTSEYGEVCEEAAVTSEGVGWSEC